MKKYMITIITILLLILLISICTTRTYAAGIDLGDLESYKGTSQAGSNDELIPIGNIVVWVVRIIGSGIAVLMLAIIGIRYVMGSVEEKAEYKQTMWPYIVGAFLLFAGSSVANVIYQMLNS